MNDRPVSLVTGAGRGIGRGIAVELAKLGHAVVVNYAGNAGDCAGNSHDSPLPLLPESSLLEAVQVISLDEKIVERPLDIKVRQKIVGDSDLERHGLDPWPGDESVRQVPGREIHPARALAGEIVRTDG